MYIPPRVTGDELALVYIRDKAGNVGTFLSAVERLAQTLADAENVIIHPMKDEVEVSTFLRIGVAHTWREADKLETYVRAQIYVAAFGSLDARGALVAKDDPLIASIPTLQISWGFAEL